MAKFTKGPAECYHIRTDNGWSWATLIARDNGQVFIASDYGNWFYWWSHHGCPSIKHFLIDIGEDYLRGKLGGIPRHFNQERVVTMMLQSIVERRREGRLEKEKAREAWAALKERIDCYGSAEAFGQAVFDNDALDGLFDYEDLRGGMEHEPGLIQFTERLWPLFVAELRRELGMEVRA